MTGQPEQETITHLAAQVAALRGQVRLINGRLDRAGLKELSTLAAEWHRTYSRPPPDLARALEFYDRWLPKHHAPGRSYSA